jgi:hypothetical protein
MIWSTATPSLDQVLYVARHMREKDRLEIFATRDSEDPDLIAHDALATGAGAGVCLVLGEERPIVAMGCVRTWAGQWQVWMFATDEFRKAARRATENAQNVIIAGMRQMGLRRAECHSIGSHEIAHRWLERLGFEREAEVPAYGKRGESFYRYVLRGE